MLDIVLIGLNHKTASVELRECLAFSQEEADSAMDALKASPAIQEVILFSTCNRVEVLLATRTKADAIEAAKRYISDIRQLPVNDFEDALYSYEGDEAVRHIFMVAASLDSMMVGEPQILGQIKEAYSAATLRKSSGVILNRLMHRTFFIAKRIRSETGIGGRAVSISYAAVELGRKIFGSFDDKKVLLIGAGEMAELAVEHLIRNHAGDILVANRTFERGLELAQKFNGRALRYEELTQALETVDIIISSTGSPNFVLVPEQVKKALRSRRHRPLFFIDIAVPRDIHPDINRLPNTYVYDIDDLKGVIEENIDDRKKEAIVAQRMIDEAVINFRKWYESLDVVPTIVAMRRKIDTIARAELKRTCHTLNHLSPKDHQALERMAGSMVNKILHDPTILLKGKDDHWNRSVYVDTLRKLFKLDQTE